jgi:hypothetical protein
MSVSAVKVVVDSKTPASSDRSPWAETLRTLALVDFGCAVPNVLPGSIAADSPRRALGSGSMLGRAEPGVGPSSH